MELLLNTTLAIALFFTVLQRSLGEKEGDYYSNNFDVLLNYYKVKPLKHSRIYREFSRMRLPTGKKEENNTNMDNAEDQDAKDAGEPSALQEVFSVVDFPKSPQENKEKPSKIPLRDVDMTTEKEIYYSPNNKAEEFNDLELETLPWIFRMKENKKFYDTYYKNRRRIPTTVTYSTTPISDSIGAKSLEETKNNLNNMPNSYISNEGNHLGEQGLPEAESL